jgi:hypothetical protein
MRQDSRPLEHLAAPDTFVRYLSTTRRYNSEEFDLNMRCGNFRPRKKESRLFCFNVLTHVFFLEGLRYTTKLSDVGNGFRPEICALNFSNSNPISKGDESVEQC